MSAAGTPSYPARAARERAGLSLAEAARRARIRPDYLAALERSGSFAYGLARRLARLYGAPLDAFLPSRRATGRPSGERPARGRRAPGRAGGAASPERRRGGRPLDEERRAERALRAGGRPVDYRLRRPSDPEDLPELFGHGGAPVVDGRDIDGLEPWEREEAAP